MRRYQLKNIYLSKRNLILGGVALGLLFGLVGLSTQKSVDRFGVERSVAAQTTVTPSPDLASQRKEYRETVLKHLDRGETVTVPNDRIEYLGGAVKLLPSDRVDKGMKALGVTKGLPAPAASGFRAEIEGIAAEIKDPVARDGLKNFAAKASEDEKYKFLYVGGVCDLNNYLLTAGPVAKPTDTKKECYDSCQTMFRVVCKEVCKWDCRIVNGEKVCEQSCSTICPEVSNVVCHRVCN